MFEVKEGQRRHHPSKVWVLLVLLAGSVMLGVGWVWWVGLVGVLSGVAQLVVMARGLNPWWVQSTFDAPHPAKRPPFDPSERPQRPPLAPPHRQVQ